MELVQNKKEDTFFEWFPSNIIKNSNRPQNISELNKQSLKELTNYISNLKKDDIIDENQFSELIMIMCTNFIENEIEWRLSKFLNNKIMYFIEKF